MYLRNKFVMPFCAVAITVYMASCESEPFLEDSSNLDINSCVPLTRSSPQDINQGVDYSYKEVPVYEGECMLNAILNIAVKNRIPVFEKYISPTYSAATAYDKMKKHATDFTTDNEDYEEPYLGGAMFPSIGAEVGRASGILEGTIINFNNYEELYKYIDDTSWKSEHPNGRYIINFTQDGNSHTSICRGTNDGDIKIYSTENGYTKMAAEENYLNISIIY